MFKHLRLKRPLALIDVESTGLDVRADRVVELAVLKLAPGRKPAWAVRRLNPTVPIPPAATAVHGLTDGDVKDCPTFADVARKLAKFLGDCDLGGFGVRGFDVPIMAHEFCRAGVPFATAGRRVLDALPIYHQRERRDLAAAYAFYCGKRHDAHRADRDVFAAAEVIDAQLGRYADLPRTVAGLDAVVTEIEAGRRLRPTAGGPVFGFGKHRGRRLADVARSDPAYLEWVLSGDFPDDVKAAARLALGEVGR